MDRWTPPSFDAETSAKAVGVQVATGVKSVGGITLPTIDEIQDIRAKAYQEAFTRGLQEGLIEGRNQASALGREEGLEIGRQEGFQTGYQQGYQSGAQDIEQLGQSLKQVLQRLAGLPDAFQTALPEWVYETALRLAGKEQMDRSVFVAAVQEALLRLPRPGQSLTVGVPAAELEAWEKLLQDPAMPFTAVVRADPELSAGYAYVQVEGTRLDVGSRAREALVRSALGLLPHSAPGQV
jgi:flagellar assembly protein FliH